MKSWRKYSNIFILLTYSIDSKKRKKKKKRKKEINKAGTPRIYMTEKGLVLGINTH